MPKTLGAVANNKIKVNVRERSIQNIGEKWGILVEDEVINCCAKSTRYNAWNKYCNYIEVWYEIFVTSGYWLIVHIMDERFLFLFIFLRIITCIRIHHWKWNARYPVQPFGPSKPTFVRHHNKLISKEKQAKSYLIQFFFL